MNAAQKIRVRTFDLQRAILSRLNVFNFHHLVWILPRLTKDSEQHVLNSNRKGLVLRGHGSAEQTQTEDEPGDENSLFSELKFSAHKNYFILKFIVTKIKNPNWKRKKSRKTRSFETFDLELFKSIPVKTGSVCSNEREVLLCKLICVSVCRWAYQTCQNRSEQQECW